MMFELGRHGGYILASYVVTIVIMGALVVQTIMAHRRARARLDAMGDDE